MRGVRRVTITIVLVAALAAGAAAANLALLRSTQDSSDPVGRLSPRAVFPQTATAPGTTTTQPGSGSHDDGGRHGEGPDD